MKVPRADFKSYFAAYSDQLTPVKSVAWVGAFFQRPWTFASATVVKASSKRKPFT
jgi:hypothetical protein